MPFVLAGVLIGTVLGMRFTVLALVPTAACAALIAGTNSVLGGEALGPTIAHLIWFVNCLQIGFVSGAALRLALVRATSLRGPDRASLSEQSVRRAR